MMSMRKCVYLFLSVAILLLQSLSQAANTTSKSDSNLEKPKPSINSGYSQQDCSITWANEGIRTKFWRMSNPPSYYCRNAGGQSYACQSCWSKQDLKPEQPRLFTQSSPASACTVTDYDKKQVAVNNMPCMAYNLNPSSGRLSCLTQTFQLLTCHAGHPDPSYVGTVCDQCRMFIPDSVDHLSIFRDGSDLR